MDTYEDNLDHILHKADVDTSIDAADHTDIVNIDDLLKETSDWLKDNRNSLPNTSQEFFDEIPDLVYEYTEHTIGTIVTPIYTTFYYPGGSFTYISGYNHTPIDETETVTTADRDSPDTDTPWHDNDPELTAFNTVGSGGPNSTSIIKSRTSGPVLESGDNLKDILVDSYKTAVGYNEWPQILKDKVSPEDIENQFDNLFDNFLLGDAYSINSTKPLESFLTSWGDYLTTIATYGQIVDGKVISDNAMITSLLQVVSDIGFSFAPEDIIADIYKQHIDDFGFFSPGRALQDWVQKSASGYLQSKGVKVDDDSIVQLPSVTTDQTKRVIVLNRIFNLLVLMIQILQDVAAAQAERLTFLSRWQKGYTDLIAQIRTFTRDDGTVIGRISDNDDTDADLGDIRSGINQKMMNAREKLSAWRSVIGDDAKALQSRLNQSTDAVNQQANMATAIIQQLTTILAAIYK